MTLLVADATNLTHRCWHATGRSSDPQVVARMIVSLLTAGVARSSATAAAAVFDGPGAGGHRYELYSAYKAGRAEKEQALKDALAAMPGLLSEQGIDVIQVAGAEADDVLACYAQQEAATVLLTSDKDALGLLQTEHVSLLRVGNGGPSSWQRVNRDSLEEHTGVSPQAWELYAALKGDSSDNIPGVSGIGPTFATKLAASLVTVDAFCADLESGGERIVSVVGKARGARLVASREQVLADIRLSEQLAAPVAVHGLPDRAGLTLPAALTPASGYREPDSSARSEEASWVPEAPEPAEEQEMRADRPGRSIYAAVRPAESPVRTPSKPTSFSDFL